MPATVITFGIQKGGAGKTTTAAVTAYMLSQTHKVLVVDMDSQGNITELLTMSDLDDFRNDTIFEGIKNVDVRPHIRQITENLMLVPCDNFFANFTTWLFTQYKGNEPTQVLRHALEPVMDFYDYIILDTPPALSKETINALSASDFVVPLFETSRYSLTAMRNFLGTVGTIQDITNPNIKIAGILRSIIDNRRKDAKALLEIVVEEYQEYAHIFSTVITRTAHVGRLNLEGFNGNAELSKILNDYEPFLKELMERVNVLRGQNTQTAK